MKVPLISDRRKEGEKKRLASFKLTMKKRRAEKSKKRKMDKQNAKRKKERAKKRRERERLKQREKEKELRRKEREKERKKREREKKKHKRPVGRPKKVGRPRKYKRPKKKKPRIYTKLPPFSYRVIMCCNHRQIKIMGRFRTLDDSYELFKKLQEESKDVVFPATFYAGEDMALPSIYEYLIISQTESASSSYFRDEYGQLKETKTDNENWHIIDKCSFQKEETFWVFGYDNRKERKTFDWVYENLVLNYFSSKYDFRRMILYKNKVIFKDDSNNIDLVICKCEYDAVKMCNMILERAKKDKIKNLLFLGDFSKHSEKKKKLEDELVELTSWTRKKVQMKNTTYFTV